MRRMDGGGEVEERGGCWGVEKKRKRKCWNKKK